MVGFSFLAFSFYDCRFFIHLLRRQNNDQKCDILQLDMIKHLDLLYILVVCFVVEDGTKCRLGGC